VRVAAAPSEAAAAEYYPAIYWYSMLNIPEAKLFPGTGPAGNGKARRQALLPLLEQVALTALQLDLTPQQVLAQLKPLLEENPYA